LSADEHLREKYMQDNKLGIEIREFKLYNIPISQTYIKNENAAKGFEKHIIIKTGPLGELESLENVCNCLAEQLGPLLEPYFEKPLCICGIGNCDVPAEALGPKTAEKIRPFAYDNFTFTSNFSKVAVICPGMHHKTNLSNKTIISGVATAMNAACVLTIDSCVAEELDSLCSRIQLSDTGMDGYYQMSDLEEPALEVPVISVVVPTTIYKSQLVSQHTNPFDFTLAPTDIIDVVNTAAVIIACAITQTICPKLDYKNCRQFIDFIASNIAP